MFSGVMILDCVWWFWVRGFNWLLWWLRVESGILIEGLVVVCINESWLGVSIVLLFLMNVIWFLNGLCFDKLVNKCFCGFKLFWMSVNGDWLVILLLVYCCVCFCVWDEEIKCENFVIFLEEMWFWGLIGIDVKFNVCSSWIWELDVDRFRVWKFIYNNFKDNVVNFEVFEGFIGCCWKCVIMNGFDIKNF